MRLFFLILVFFDKIRKNFARSSNGRTAGSEPANLGSNPSWATEQGEVGGEDEKFTRRLRSTSRIRIVLKRRVVSLGGNPSWATNYY